MGLVITRTRRQRFVIDGPDGTRTVVEIAAVADSKVRLKITAPPDVGVWREELLSQPLPDAEGRFSQ